MPVELHTTNIAYDFQTRSGAVLVSAAARRTEDTVYYQFQFDIPLDKTMPRVGRKNNR